jgi:hypothetical protein
MIAKGMNVGSAAHLPTHPSYVELQQCIKAIGPWADFGVPRPRNSTGGIFWKAKQELITSRGQLILWEGRTQFLDTTTLEYL